uniref:Sema domain-containing protein n=1 Tax=Amphilophus citrinellus TaxID=61819 RepID=A0A3Q0S5L0_AMPCI
ATPSLSKCMDLNGNLQLLVHLSALDVDLKQFREPGFDSLSSLMVRDDIGQLVLGTRGKVLALSLDDITKQTSEVRAFSADKDLCQMKGKSVEECDNFIRILHTVEDGKMLVCGTNAFNPMCDYLVSNSNSLQVTERVKICKVNKCIKFRLFPLHSKGDTLYSAASTNFLGTEMVFQRHGLNPVKTEIKRSWLNDPTMISLSLVQASKNSSKGEDDNVFLFFHENAVEELHGNILVSRIARVCKSDLGGKRTLQQKWTSFLKARLDCPFGDVGSSSLVQDVFLLPDKNDWRDSVFYATFISNSQSAVCAYKLSDISQVFSGRFLTEMDTGNWDIYTGEEPSPHPGSCIDDEMRVSGVMSSLNLSDTTLLFMKNHPLMEGVVTPITGKPLLFQPLTQFSKIVVDQVTSLDGQQHQIMLIGTDSGWLQKAVKFEGEDGRVIEELQLFRDAQPVDFLQLSSKTGHLYSGTSNAAVQIDVRDCRYTSCDDCLLARDPYCGWDQSRHQCASICSSSRIQSLSDGDIRMCLPSECKCNIHEKYRLTKIDPQLLSCSPETNLPISWRFSDNVLYPGPRYIIVSQGLIIRPSYSDAGLYSCETVEAVKGRVHRKTIVQYLVQVQDTHAIIRNLKVALITVAVVAGLLIFSTVRAVVIGRLKVKKRKTIK